MRSKIDVLFESQEIHSQVTINNRGKYLDNKKLNELHFS